MFRLYDNWHEIENCKGYDQQKPCIIICQLCQKTATWAWTSCLAPLVLSVLIFEDKYLRTRLLRWHSGKEATCQCSRLKSSVQCSSGAQLCLTLCNPIHCSIPGLPVHHQLPEFTQTHVHWVSDAIQPSHPLLSPSPPALNLSKHQGLFKQVSSLHQVDNVREFPLQHQSFQWTFRTDFL